MKHLGFFFFLLIVLASCRTTRETQTEYVYVNSTDTIHEVKLRIDSIVIHDSVMTLVKGDSVLTERWHTAYRDRLRVDTVEKIRTETVYQTLTETKIQEVNKLYWWQKTLMWIGETFIVLILGFGNI